MMRVVDDKLKLAGWEVVRGQGGDLEENLG